MPQHLSDYCLELAYPSANAAQRAAAVAFWLAQGALLDRETAQHRADELVYLVRHADGTLAGVSTAGRRTAADGRIWLAFRMFLRPEDRTPFLMRRVTNASRDLLGAVSHPQGPATGMLIETENRKLMRPGIRRYFARHGYRYAGRSQRGLDLWLAPFAGAEDRTAVKPPVGAGQSTDQPAAVASSNP